MKYCLRCAREIGEGRDFCPYCGYSQKKSAVPEQTSAVKDSSIKLPIIVGTCVIFVIILVVVAFVEKASINRSNHAYKQHSIPVQEKIFSSPTISVSARQILSDYDNNEIRAGERYNGKRVRIAGCAANIDNSLGILSVFVNSCGGPLNLKFVHARFPDNAKSSLTSLNKGQRIIVECTVIDGGNVMGVAAENCVLK